MKIALVAQHTVPTKKFAFASAERPDGLAEDDVRVRHLSHNLAANGHDVTVYAQRPDEREPGRTELSPGVRMEYLGPITGRNDSEMLARVGDFAAPLRDRFGEDPPDVVHAVRWTSGLAALSAVRDLRIPVVQSFSPLCVTERRHHLVPSTAGQERIRLEPAIGRGASAVLADCSDEESELTRAGVPRRSIRVIPCGVDVNAFAPEGPAADRNGRPRIVTVTELDSYEDVATLFRALARVPDAELVVAGGPPRDELEEDPAHAKLTELAEHLGVDDRVEFAGRVSRGALPPLLRSADLLVSVCDYDPFGMTVLEAMACGVPVVATGTGCQVDAIIDGTTGLLVPPRRPEMLAHRIRRLMDHPMQMAAFGAAAADRARSRFSWDRIARETLAVYDHTVDKAA